MSEENQNAEDEAYDEARYDRLDEQNGAKDMTNIDKILLSISLRKKSDELRAQVRMSDDKYMVCFHNHCDDPAFSVWRQEHNTEGSARFILGSYGGVLVDDAGIYNRAEILEMAELTNKSLHEVSSNE